MRRHCSVILYYPTFFSFLTANCEPDPYSYISWVCTPDKNTICENITRNWIVLKNDILNQADDSVTVKLDHFDIVEVAAKSGNIVKRLKAISTNANMAFIVEFISSFLKNIIHHRNQLRHYRSCITVLRELFGKTLSLDIDFSENLTVPVKYEPQSLHWSHEQITVHSGILKDGGEKSYHAYLSNDKQHDQKFVKVVLKEMLNEADTKNASFGIIESDNCSSQYKSASHFSDIQEISNELNIPIIRVFGVAQHGKGEVDHVRGLAKVAIRREIAAGTFFANAADMVSFLNSKFGDKVNPNYCIKEIDCHLLDTERTNARLHKYHTIKGSSSFQIILFTPNSTVLKAASRICICEKCLLNYGSCSLFHEYSITVQELNKVSLRSNFDVDFEENNWPAVNSFILPNSICAIAADTSSVNTVWFVKIIVDEIEADHDMGDDYGHTVATGVSFFTGNFLEEMYAVKDGCYYKMCKKDTFIFKESIVYPFVQFQPRKKGYFLPNTDLVEILNYIEQNGLASL